MASSLHRACALGSVEDARSFLDRGAVVDATDDEYSRSPLHYACLGRHLDVATLLLDRGADVDRTEDGYWSPLMMACKKGCVATANLLWTAAPT